MKSAQHMLNNIISMNTIVRHQRDNYNGSQIQVQILSKTKADIERQHPQQTFLVV